jgi:hypothetical protein
MGANCALEFMVNSEADKKGVQNSRQARYVSLTPMRVLGAL